MSTAMLLTSSEWLWIGGRIVIVAGAVVGYGLVLVATTRGTTLPLAAVVAGIVVVLGVAVAMPPRESGDLYTYALYGRIVAFDHANPYQAEPEDFPNEPLLHRDTHPEERYLYGPAFLGVNAAAAPIAGTSGLRTRVVYQLLAALAVALALLLVWRRTRDPAALAWFGLNPVVALHIVNGGHNDALIGLAVLGAALSAERRRWKTAGLLVAMAALVKFWAIVAGVGLVIFAWRRRDRIGAAVSAATTAAVVVLGYLIVGGLSALQPLESARNRVSAASVWKVPMEFGFAPVGVGWVTAATAIVVLACVTSPRLRSAAGAAFGGLGGYLLAAPYTLAWYGGAVLPVAALERRRAVAFILSAQAALMLVWYQVFLHAPPHDLGRVVLDATRWLAPVVSVVLVVAYLIAIRAGWRTRAAAPTAPATGAGEAPVPADARV